MSNEPNTTDMVLVERGLKDLPELPAARQNVPKIIILQRGQTKINHRCPKAKMSVVITMEDSRFRTATGKQLDEYECKCGQIFQKQL